MTDKRNMVVIRKPKQRDNPVEDVLLQTIERNLVSFDPLRTRHYPTPYSMPFASSEAACIGMVTNKAAVLGIEELPLKEEMLEMLKIMRDQMKREAENRIWRTLGRSIPIVKGEVQRGTLSQWFVPLEKKG